MAFEGNAQPTDLRTALAMQMLGLKTDPLGDGLAEKLKVSAIVDRTTAVEKLHELANAGLSEKLQNFALTGKLS